MVATETDALLLENNLIKKYQPRYNVMLKDDKSYPWLCIKNERFPRVFSTRKLIKDGSEYYGPYTNMKTVHTLLDLIKGLYPLRTCNYDLSEEKIQAGKYKVCLEYHLGNCLGPCEDKFSEEAYQENIEAIRNIIKGNFKESLNQFKKQMKHYSEKLQFEDAQRVKEKIDILENYQAKSTVVNPKINNVDVFSIVSDESYAYINFLQLSFGSIIRSHTLKSRRNSKKPMLNCWNFLWWNCGSDFILNPRKSWFRLRFKPKKGFPCTYPKRAINGKFWNCQSAMPSITAWNVSNRPRLLTQIGMKIASWPK